MTNSEPALTKRNFLLAGGVLFLGTLAVYLSMPTKNYYWDGIYFALHIERSSGIQYYLFHANHLVYEVVSYWVYAAARQAGLHLRAIEGMQMENSLLGALGTLVVFGILTFTTRSLYIACTLSLLFAFSVAWWRFSTDADSYIASVVLMLVAFCLVLSPGKARPLRVGVTHAGAMLFHQLAVFFFPVLLLGLAFQAPNSTRAKRFWAVFQYAAAAALLTLSAYAYGFAVGPGEHSLPRFLGWMTSHASDAHFSFNPWSNLVKTLRSQVQLVLGGRLSSLVRFANPVIVALTLLLLCLAILCLLGIVAHPSEVGSLFRCAFARRGELTNLWKLSLLWAGVYLAFLYFWLPHIFYRLFYLPALVLFCGVALARYEKANPRVRRGRVALLVSVVALWNFLFYVFPNAHAENNPVVSMALRMNPSWPPGTTVYYSFLNADDWYFSYFNPQSVWKQFDDDKLAKLNRELVSVYDRRGTAWIDITGIDSLSASPTGKWWLEAHSRSSPRCELVEGGHHIRFLQLFP
jgi:hypothetical protein